MVLFWNLMRFQNSTILRFDVVSNLEKQLKEASSVENPDTNAIKNLQAQIKKAKKNDIEARTIITTNLSLDVVEKIQGLSSAYVIMEKLKSLYVKRKSNDVQYLMRRLYTIKANCMENISEIFDVLEKLEKLKVTMNKLEKLRIIYLSLPLSICKDVIIPITL